MKFLIWFVATSFCISNALAAPVAEIKTTGLLRIERDAVLEKLTSKTGTEYSATSTRADVEALYGMGYFDDVEISKDSSDKGIVLTYAFKERPVINEVLFEGNEKINTSDLEEKPRPANSCRRRLATS